MSDEELRNELAVRGLREHVSEADLTTILNDHGYLPPRARSFQSDRTEEARIATAVESVEIP